jgi:hypothetical protein
MAEQQATALAGDKLAAADTTAKGDTSTGVVDTSTASSTAGATSKLPHAWMEGLTAEQKADADLVKALSKFEKGIPDFAKAYPELEKKLGQSVIIPNEKSTPEERAAYRKAAGIPDKPEDYKLDKVGLTHVKPDEGRVAELLALAQKFDVPQKAMNELYKAFMKGADEDFASLLKVGEKAKAETLALLKKDLGSKYDEAIALKDRALDAVGKKYPEAMERYVKWANQGAGNEAVNIEMWAIIGGMLGEHAFVDGSSGTPESEGIPGKRTDAQLAAILYGKKTS